MKILKNVLHISGAIALASIFSACTESGTEPIFNPNPVGDYSSSSYKNPYSSASFSPNSIQYEELEYNYDLLDLYYLYAHRNGELKDFDNYTMEYVPYYDSKSYCTKKYANTCYLYGDMSDPFTRYFDPEYAQQIMDLLTYSEANVGIGAQAKEVKVNDSIKVVIDQVYENGPAEKAGLAVGDTVLKINDLDITYIERFDAMTNGRNSERLTIEVNRGDSVKSLTVIQGEYNTPTVFLTFEDSIPVIRITEFDQASTTPKGSYGEFVRTLKKIKDDYKAAIIDLRDNPGGDVEHCSKMSGELLNAGDTIIIDIETNVDSSGYGNSKNYFQKFDTTAYTAETDGIGKDLYYVFLANENSASCAELMLSAVTVNKKSPVVGQTTYGKGIGQYVIPTTYVADGLALITGLESMDKNGGIYHKVGIVPDYAIDDSDKQMKKAVEIAKNALDGNKEERKEGYGTESTGNFAKAKARSSFTIPTSKKELLDQMSGTYKFKNSAK